MINATKHFTFQRWGELGVHASVIQFDGFGIDNDHTVTLGTNFRFRREGDEFWTQALNGLNLMGELYDGRVNVGGTYRYGKTASTDRGSCMEGSTSQQDWLILQKLIKSNKNLAYYKYYP